MILGFWVYKILTEWWHCWFWDCIHMFKGWNLLLKLKINPNLVLTFVYYQGTLDYCSTCLKDHPEQDNPDKEHSFCPVYKVNTRCPRNKPKMAYSRDLPKMARWQCGIMDWYSLVWFGRGGDGQMISEFIHEEISIMDYNGLSWTIKFDYKLF